MEIQKKLDGTTLTVTVTGHIDTVTAPQLEAELALDSANALVFDITGV
jgi:anti-anti-sigma regulatory factor